jgi:hypothetical protein
MERSMAVVALLIALALAGLAAYGWVSLGDVQMDASGYIALVAGVIFTIALGGGLMALVFYSHRSGYDERAGGGKGRSQDD